MTVYLVQPRSLQQVGGVSNLTVLRLLVVFPGVVARSPGGDSSIGRRGSAQATVAADEGSDMDLDSCSSEDEERGISEGKFPPFTDLQHRFSAQGSGKVTIFVFRSGLKSSFTVNAVASGGDNGCEKEDSGHPGRDSTENEQVCVR